MNKNLRAYKITQERLLKEKGEKPAVKKVIEYSKRSINNYFGIKKIDTEGTIEIKSKKYVQKTLEGKKVAEYIIRDEVKEEEFNKVLSNRSKLGYVFIIYILESKLEPFKDLPYIGYTKNLKKRYRMHLMSAIGPHGLNQSYVNVVPLHRAIINVVEHKGNFELIQENISSLSSESIILEDKDDLYAWLMANKNTKKQKIVLDYIIDNIFLVYFNSVELELHKFRKSTQKREKYLTKNYIHYVNKKRVVGTIWPNGLNAVVGGSGGEHIPVPISDVIALTSLGINLDSISKIITKVYKLKINPDIISRRLSDEDFESFEGLQEEVLKPVVELLMKGKEDFDIYEISEALGIPERTLRRRIKKWFSGATFSQLKLLVNQSKLDWTKIKSYLKEFKKTIRGFPIDKWKKWAIEEIPTKRIGEIVDVSDKTIMETFKQISYLLVWKEDLGLRSIRKILRREKAKELLKKGIHPKEILEKIFKMSVGEKNHKRVLSYLFDMPYKEIMDKYYLP